MARVLRRLVSRAACITNKFILTYAHPVENECRRSVQPPGSLWRSPWTCFWSRAAQMERGYAEYCDSVHFLTVSSISGGLIFIFDLDWPRPCVLNPNIDHLKWHCFQKIKANLCVMFHVLVMFVDLWQERSYQVMMPLAVILGKILLSASYRHPTEVRSVWSDMVFPDPEGSGVWVNAGTRAHSCASVACRAVGSTVSQHHEQETRSGWRKRNAEPICKNDETALYFVYSYWDGQKLG